MSGRQGLQGGLLVALVAAATTWVSTLSWRGFTTEPELFLWPLFLLALLVAGTGALARASLMPLVSVVALQVVVSGLVAAWLVTGSPLPLGTGWTDLVAAFEGANLSASRYAPPVPGHVPGVHPLLIAGGLGCMLLVDVLACTLRRVPLAGLPLLTVHTVPVSLLQDGPSWWIFVLSAAGFLTLLFLHESEQVAHWGRSLDRDPTDGQHGPGGAQAFDVRTGALRASAGRIGGVATALAVVVPLVVPTLNLSVLELGAGSGSGSDIRLENPMTDMRRDLQRGDDVPLVRVRTDDPRPEYLRISVLNRFSANEWSSGDRDIPTDQLPSGPMPPLVGVEESVPRAEYDYEVSVNDGFETSWLPTESAISSIVAQGDWRYDLSTRDFIAGDEDLDAAGLEYSLRSVELDLTPEEMVAAPSSLGLVSQEYVDLPTGMPLLVRQLATEVTAGAASPFEKAVALQDWFRRDGGFTYTLDVDLRSGADDLESFLSTGDGGRRGYCEQFASAMAVMARAVGIPARVAVGFLSPDRVGTQEYEYSSDDLHSWPELFVPGAGWVRFEPTPPDRARSAPGYTDIEVGPGAVPQLPSEAGQPSIDQPDRGASASPSAEATDDTAGADGSDDGAGFPWRPALGGVAGLVLVSLLLLMPRALRRARRSRRLAAGGEQVWEELRDTAVDLGVPWPARRSPRETRHALVQHFGAPRGDERPERPAHGPEQAPAAVAALDRVVRLLELQRYARSGTGDGTTLAADARTCVAALEDGASRSARRRAEWWPRSVVSTGTGRTRRRGRAASVTGPSGLVDEVG